MDDIEEVESVISCGDRSSIYNVKQTYYLKAIVETQLLILKELRKMKE